MIVRALRFRGDEVQLGRALHAICQQDETVAEAFVIGVLSHAAMGPDGTQAARFAERIPHRVLCQGERELFEVRRGHARDSARLAGRVDLYFTDEKKWQLAVELKIDSPLGPEQCERYLRARKPLVVITRDPTAVPAPKVGAKSGAGWLGAVSWSALKPDMEGLPLVGSDKEIWLELLEIMDQDGDFDQRRPPKKKELQRDIDIVDRVQSSVVDSFRNATVKRYRRNGRELAETMKAYSVHYGGHASFAIKTDEGTLVEIVLRHSSTPSPVIAVTWFPPEKRSAMRSLREAHERLESRGFEQRAGKRYTHRASVPPASANSDISTAIQLAMIQEINAIVDSDVLAWELGDS